MGNIISIIFYVVLFMCSAVALFYGRKREKTWLVVVALMIPVLIAGLRYNVGTDFKMYVSMYDAMSGLNLGSYLGTYGYNDLEPSFFPLVKAASLVPGGAFVFFLLTSFITVFFTYLGLRRFAPKHLELLYLLYLLMIFPLTFNMVRQGMAMAVFFYATSFIIDRQLRNYAVWAIIASMCHFSALILLPTYLIAYMIRPGQSQLKQNLKRSLSLTAAVIVLIPITLLLIPHLPILGQYARDIRAAESSGVNLSFYLYLLELILFAYYYKKLYKVDVNALYYFVFTLLSLSLLALGFWSDSMRRISLYFSIFSLILLIYSAFIAARKAPRYVGYAVVVFFGLSYFVLAYFIMGNSDILPYQSILTASI